MKYNLITVIIAANLGIGMNTFCSQEGSSSGTFYQKIMTNDLGALPPATHEVCMQHTDSLNARAACASLNTIACCLRATFPKNEKEKNEMRSICGWSSIGDPGIRARVIRWRMQFITPELDDASFNALSGKVDAEFDALAQKSPMLKYPQNQ